MVDIAFTDAELRLARQGALSASRSGRGLVPLGDLVGEAHLWMVEHYEKVLEWREKGTHGANTLRLACKQKCLNVVATERRKRSGLQAGDSFYYSQAIMRELLPVIWQPDDWTASNEVNDIASRSPSRPSEGNNRIAMIVDVKVAFDSLPERDRILLTNLYLHNRTFDSLALEAEVSERTIRRREERALERMVERLGGDSPWR